MASDPIQNHANLIWGIADLLRGDYKPSEYGRVILPLVVMRRLDQALTDTKDAVLETAKRIEEAGIANTEPALRQAAHQQFFNRTAFPGEAPRGPCASASRLSEPSDHEWPSEGRARARSR